VERTYALRAAQVQPARLGPPRRRSGDGARSRVAGSRGVQAEAKSERLNYSIELWDRRGAAVERVLARAVSVVLARAIFAAAVREHPQRYITLCRGAQVIAESER
jgi:hypothetical protein